MSETTQYRGFALTYLRDHLKGELDFGRASVRAVSTTATKVWGLYPGDRYSAHITRPESSEKFFQAAMNAVDEAYRLCPPTLNFRDPRG